MLISEKIYDLFKTKNFHNQEFEKLRNYFSNSNYKKVAIYLDRNYKYLLSILVLMDIGITFIPLNKKFPNKRNQLIIDLSNPDFIIDNESYSEILNSNYFYKEKEKENILYIIFTSGSTGIPKGVQISRNSYENFLNWVNKYFNINKNEKLLQITDFTFDMSMLDIALFINKKLEIKFLEIDNDIFNLALFIQKYKISVLVTVPNNINMLYSDFIRKKFDLSSLKYLLIGGAKFTYGLYQKINLKNINVYNLYGPTEATVYISCEKIDKNSLYNNNVSVGKIIENNDVIIYNNEVLISGNQLMIGYLQNEYNKKAFIQIEGNKYYKTGDIGFFYKGKLFIKGRLDDTIKTRGYRVNLTEIDSLISKIPYIEEVSVISIKEEIVENKIIAFIKTNMQDKEKIYKDLQNLLLPYQIPSEIIFIDKFPLNSSGKISKKELKKLYKERLND